MSDTDAAHDWGAVAEAWDRHVDDVDVDSDAIIAAMLRRAAPCSGDRVLELAAGPGSLGPVWASLVGSTGRVVLSDIAPAMVDVARRRNAHLAGVECAVVDASAIDHADGSFDVVACRMGLMFTPDPGAALAEIRRVLDDGGRFAAVTWAGLEHNPWMTCVGMAAMMHGLVSGGPPVGPGGIFSLGDPSVLASLTETAGFDDVTVEEVTISFRSPTVDEHVARVASLAGPLAGALRAASEDQRAAVQRTAAELAAPYLTESGLDIPGRALLVSGRP